jgi:hypothetical protein
VIGPIRLRTANLEWRDVQGEVVAVDLEASVYLAVNRTGTTLWPLLDRGTDHQELIARLMVEFGIDAEIAERDVDAFVDALRRRGLLEEGGVGMPDRTDGPAPGG